MKSEARTLEPASPANRVADPGRRPVTPSSRARGGHALPRLLARVQGFVPESLIDQAGWDRVADRVGHLPALPVARRAGFELHLSEPEPGADFIVSLGKGGDLFSYYRDRAAGGMAGPAGSLGTFLKKVDDRPEDWRWLRGVMLEYDVATAPHGIRTPPGVFLGLRGGCVAAARLRGQPAGEVLAEAIADAVGWEPHPEEVRALVALVRALPEQGELMQVGAMPGRRPRLLRVTATFADSEGIRPFLERVRWPGSLAEVERVLERMQGAAPSVFAVSLGVGARLVHSRLGIEIYRTKGDRVLGIWTDTDREDWRPLLDGLEAERWCLPQKVRGLRELPALHRICSSQGVGLLYFGIAHLKLTLGGDGATAKAYAGMRFIPP